MITLAASKGASFLCQQTGDNSRYAVYRYGLECILNECIADCLIFTIGCLSHKPFEMFLWMATFTICRINMGGWHAPNHFICISCSVLAGSVPLLMSNEMSPAYNPSFCTLTLLAYFVWALVKLPLHTSRHIVSRQRQVFAKCIDAGIISFLLLIINICGSVSSYIYFVYIAITEAVILTLFNK